MCFGIIAENFEAFENDIFGYVDADGEWNSVDAFVVWRLQCGFSVDFLGTMFARGYSGVRVATFSKSSHSNTVDLLVAVVAKWKVWEPVQLDEVRFPCSVFL